MVLLSLYSPVLILLAQPLHCWAEEAELIFSQSIFCLVLHPRSGWMLRAMLVLGHLVSLGGFLKGPVHVGHMPFFLTICNATVGCFALCSYEPAPNPGPTHLTWHNVQNSNDNMEKEKSKKKKRHLHICYYFIYLCIFGLIRVRIFSWQPNVTFGGIHLCILSIYLSFNMCHWLD